MTITTNRRAIIAATLGATAVSSLPTNAAAKPAAAPAHSAVSAAQPVVEIASGRLRGFEKDGVRTFLGVPYGAPIDGDNRFQSPKPAAAWTGVRDALVYGCECPYYTSSVRPVGAAEKSEDKFLLYRNYTPHIASEDCLRLNVWTPSTSGKKPVMVYMHGGGYVGGSGSDLLAYDGANLARRGDAVVVTHNHRLNIFGYLNLSPFGGRWAQSVNLGMQDIVAVLRWVKDNIAAFGGDPANVTIFGQSGGGGKVLSLMAMPSAKGLFHKAVVQSGTFPNMSNMTPAVSAEQTKRVLAALNLTDATLDKLRTLTVDEIAAAARLPQLRWCPVVDGNVIPVEPNTAAAMAPGVPLLIGSILNETVNAVDNPDATTFDDAALTAAAAKQYGASGPAIVAAYRKSHPGRTPFELHAAMAAAALRSEAFTVADRKFAADGKVWQYLFAWNTPMLEGRPKTFHSAEIAFVFNNAGLCSNQTGGGPAAMRLSEQISDAWVAFARTGNPSHRGLPAWPACGPTHPTMVFDEKCEIALDPEGPGRKLIAQAKG